MTLSQSQFDRFAALSGDHNPIHVDPEFSSRTRFGKTVAHGMLLYSLLSGLVGRVYPGALQLQAEISFRSPSYAGEALEFSVLEIETLADSSPLFTLSAAATSPGKEPGLEGILTLMAPHLVGRVSIPAVGQVSKPASSPHTHKNLRLGQLAQRSRTFTSSDLEEYCSLIDDPNPLLCDRGYAKRKGLPDTPIPPPLLGGLFSHLLGTRLPGPGTNWLRQRLSFPNLAYPNQELSAFVEITRLRPEKDLVYLHTCCLNQSGQVVCDGEALVLISDLVV